MKLSTVQILTLQNISGIGTQAILKLLDLPFDCPTFEDLPRICAESKVKMSNPDGGGKVEVTLDALKAARSKAERTLLFSADAGIGVMSYFDESYPATLREAKDEKGKKKDPPLVLYYKGDLSVLQMPCIAVIGTREPTPVAAKAARYIAREFARQGFCIVSGLALGCDALGHEGALEAGGKTAAFLGNGLDSVYPSQNAGLAARIVEGGGLLMSEYPIGSKVTTYSLVARDRLQAGLSLATVVIQTGVSGGTMHAANATLNSGKTLYVTRYIDPAADSDPKNDGNRVLVSRGGKWLDGRADFRVLKSEILKGGPRYANVIFDLDLTLVDSTCLEGLRKVRNWQEVYANIHKCVLYEGLQGVFERIRKSGTQVAIVSTAPRPYLEKMIAHFGIPCHHVVGFHDAKPIKPDPAPMLKALQLLKVRPEDVVSFGDRSIDITSSKRAGIFAVGCRWGSREEAQMLEAGCDAIIDSPREILEYL